MKRSYLLLVCCMFLLASCCQVKRTVKLGLSAPFEGRYRDLGYEALHAVRLAVRQRNEAGGVGPGHPVELVALNDFDEPDEAVIQAGKMAVDRDVLAVLGGWSPATARAAGEAYERLGLTFVAPPVAWSGAGFPSPAPEADLAPDAAFVARYTRLSGGVAPGPVALWAYAEANRLLDAMDAAAGGQRPSRAQVAAMMAR
ncbi:MAG: ABC transporter substrate-binding protein [Anaerolineae bacterium]|jgi:ABC-type branched-subunit amino acid transport system substrate-binding protein